MNQLKELIEKSTDISEEGFSIHIDEDTDLWHTCLEKVGHAQGYSMMAVTICELYKQQFGKEFLFTEKCVKNEIAYHVDCYMQTLGYKGYSLRIANILLSKTRILNSCSVIDIYTYDVNSFLQRTLFRYKKGIRPIYKNTSSDPFKKK